jgi:Na+/melibiose symporter-like transporter
MDTTGMVVGKQEKAKSKVSKRILLAWPSRSISIAVGSILLGYATYYATDFMGLSAATVGLVFMIAKIFDGFTDLVAGFLIDKTRTKWGKARPYEFALIGYWVSLVLLFSAPKMGVSLSVIYLFTIYSMVNSIWGTLLSVNENVYLANALEDRSKSVTVIALTGFIDI